MSNISKTYNGRVIDIIYTSPDTYKLKLEIENKQRIPFFAGQYAVLAMDSFEGSPFSIASAPHEEFLEFHVKDTGRGMSNHIATNLKLGHAINITAPLGKSYLKEPNSPILAIAGGLGITQMKSIIEASLYNKVKHPIHLYWGVRGIENLYLDNHFINLAKNNPNFSYVPVLSEETEVTKHKTGFVTEAILTDFPDVKDMDIYLAGPNIMVQSLLPILIQKEADKDRIFSDSL